jgi:ankyrin repeat protein
MSDELGAFIVAAVQNHPAARDMLRRSPQLLNARYIHGETVLHFLAVEGHADGVRFLAEAGAQVDGPNEFGNTALVDAATLGNAGVVGTLLQHGADPNAASTTRDNVVHGAADPAMRRSWI